MSPSNIHNVHTYTNMGETLPAQKKDLNIQKIKETLISGMRVNCDPDQTLEEFDKLFDEYKKDPNKKGALEKITKASEEAMSVVGLSTHYPVAETTTRNRPLVIQFARQLVKEFDCKMASEIALAQTAAVAYGRILEYSRLLNNCQRVDFLSKEKNGYYCMLSKEVDRANRHLTSAIMALKQIKSPGLSVCVKANTAFIAQNQQLNNLKDENDKA